MGTSDSPHSTSTHGWVLTYANTPDTYQLTFPTLTSDPTRTVPGLRMTRTPGIWIGVISPEMVSPLRDLIAGSPGRIDTHLADQLRALTTTPHTSNSPTTSTPATSTPATSAPATATPAVNEDTPLEPLVCDGTLPGLSGVPLTDLTSTGRKVDAFHAANITNALDLLHTRPRRYLDRSQPVTARTAPRDTDVALLLTIDQIGNYDRYRKYVKARGKDHTGTPVSLTWFRAPWITKKLTIGQRYITYGRIEDYQPTPTSKPTIQMVNPLIDADEDTPHPVIGIYPQNNVASKSPKQRLTTWDIHRATTECVTRLPHLIDPIPNDITLPIHLPDRATAYRHLHTPPSLDAAEAARQRLAFDELLRIQLALHAATGGSIPARGLRGGHGPLTNEFLTHLPFTLTPGQQAAWDTISNDLTQPTAMHRLLHGEVGSGKSMVAYATVLAAVDRGQQAALMAPTDLLADQLYRDLSHHVNALHKDGRPITVGYLASKTKAATRRATLSDLHNGQLDILVGTHSLITPEVTESFQDLGVVVIDEQHRFGVNQRAALSHAMPGVDTLIMSATPIPRSMALTVFGDLNVTAIPDLPPGRSPITTHWVNTDIDLTSPTAPPWAAVRAAAQKGRQSFIICPLVSDSEKLQAASAETVHQELTHGALSGLNVGLVHGQQDAHTRDTTLAALRDGTLDVVVGTTVLEVGVNVPTATQMVILDAARFGIAQLHQLRGRIGRGPINNDETNDCWLWGNTTNPIASRRLSALTTTSSGLQLAEIDLTNRGIGDLLGVTQSGHTTSSIRFVDITRDLDLVSAAHDVAQQILARDPQLRRYPQLATDITSLLGDLTDVGTKLRS